MFLKSFRVKSNTTIKGSDRKKWKAQIEQRFPSLSAADVADLMPNKGETTVMKLFTHGGAVVNVFCVLKNPLFFEVDGLIYPTVYALWRYPDMLPTFTTWPLVLPKLCGGADLMLPGVILPDGNSYGPTSFGTLRKGDPCAVNLITNKAPVAVGKTTLSSGDMFMSAKRGKGVNILHTCNDQLWALGEKVAAPNLPPPFELEAGAGESAGGDDFTDVDEVEQNEVTGNLECETSQGVGDTDQVEDLEAVIVDSVESLSVADENCSGVLNDDHQTTDNELQGESSSIENDVEDQKGTSSNSGTSELHFDSMDNLLLYCFLKAWKTNAKKVELPLLTSTFYKAFMLPCLPKGHTLDVKKSSYKKLGKFLQDMQVQGLIQVQELSKGVESVVGVNLQHPEFKKFVVDEDDLFASEPSIPPEPKKPYEPPQIEEIYLVSAAVLPLFKLYHHGKGSAFTASEVRQILTSYIKDNNLQNSEQKSIVNLDPVLAQFLLTKNENNVFHLKWDEMHSRCLQKMSLGYKITFPGREPQIHKGKIALIELSIATRAANKKVTLITNLETFGIDPQMFAHTVQIGVATSTSVGPAPNKKDGSQVLIQGNQVKFVAKLLLDEYKIPRKYIQGLELASKKGKK